MFTTSFLQCSIQCLSEVAGETGEICQGIFIGHVCRLTLLVSAAEE